MQHNDQRNWALAPPPNPPPVAQPHPGLESLQSILSRLPLQAQASPAIVAEVSRILAESPHPSVELAQLQRRAWSALTVVDARQDNRQVHLHYNFTNCFNVDNSDHSDRSTKTTTTTTTTEAVEINWRVGIALGLLALLLNAFWQSAYTQGRVDGSYHQRLEGQP